MVDVARTILVVDDNPATLYSTARVLRSAGFNVIEADAGQRALELGEKEAIDLVVLDVNLPDMDGFEVCRRLRKNDRTARIPVLHLSATFVKDIDKVHGLEVGADGYLTHPVEPPVLVATVLAFLRARKAEEEMRKSEAKFRAVFDTALSGISLVSKDLVFLEVNPAMASILGRKREELVGQLIADFVPEDRKDHPSKIAEQVEQEGFWRGSLPLLRRDGQLVHLEWNFSNHSLPGVRL